MTPLLVDLASWWLQAGLLLGAGLVLPGLVRLRDPGMRLRLGQLLLAIAILLPLLQPRAGSEAGGVPGTGPVFSLAILVTGKPPVAAASVETAVLVLLATGAALRLAWLGAGLLRLRSLRRRSRPLAPLPTPIASAIARTGATAEILVSPEIASPVTLGWLRPAVLLPESFALLEEAEQEAVACHELLHVKRRDSWALLLEEGARALLWAQPAAWGVLSGISLSREQAVDRAAVESTGDLRAYLRALAVLARLSQESPAAALPFHTRSHLVRRVAHLAKEVPMSRTRTSLATVSRGGISSPRRSCGSDGLSVRERFPASGQQFCDQGGPGEGGRRKRGGGRRRRHPEGRRRREGTRTDLPRSAGLPGGGSEEQRPGHREALGGHRRRRESSRKSSRSSLPIPPSPPPPSTP